MKINSISTNLSKKINFGDITLDIDPKTGRSIKVIKEYEPEELLLKQAKKAGFLDKIKSLFKKVK